MKRNTTPTLPIKINLPFETVKQIEFIFKDDKKDYSEVLLHKVIKSENMTVEQGDVTSSFTVYLPFTAEETMRLTPGGVYMDTRVILDGGTVPQTKIVYIKVDETLFGEVFDGEATEAGEIIVVGEGYQTVIDEETADGLILRSKSGKWVEEEVDTEATKDSKKLIESGAVYEAVDEITPFKSLESLGLTSPVTSEQVCSALPTWSRLFMPASNEDITDLPEEWGTLEIVRADPNFCVARFTKSMHGAIGEYIGRYSTNANALWSGWSELFGEHNRQKGSYTGNDSTTERSIVTSQTANGVILSSAKGIGIVTAHGGMFIDSSGVVKWLPTTEIRVYPNKGDITINSSNALVNASGTTYYWIVF